MKFENKSLSKNELKRLERRDIKNKRKFDHELELKSDQEIKDSLKLVKKYGVVEKTKEDKFNLFKKDLTKKIEEEFSDNSINTSSIIDEKLNLDYNRLKDDFERLQSYDELSKHYQLNSQQKEAISQIYSRVKEDEKKIADLNTDYSPINEKVKEIADFSKRIINEISGDYINKKPDYRILK